MWALVPGYRAWFWQLCIQQKTLPPSTAMAKKLVFMLQAKLDLKLENLEVVNARVEAFASVTPFDVITSRAFSSLANMVDGTKHLLSPSGVYLAMKGLYPEEELKALMDRHEIELQGCEPLNVPGTDGDRHLVILRNRY